MSRSPYELSTPPEVLARLHPRLRTYFAAVPPGHVGRGEGVFTVVGTPRRWVWPVLAWFARDAVMFPVWERDVPFTVENRPARVRRGPGTGLEARPAVRAHRTFRFRSGARTMVDAITAEPDGLVDHLGRRGRVSARLRAQVDDTGPDAGALRLVSTRVTFRALGRDLRLPAALSPRVTLTERFDDEADLQRVSLVLTAPVVGTLYRYEGAFRYEIAPDTERG
ncbi:MULTISPECIES: DUF4166 domain-containing protein [Curtobacterium]|uniref:DUF4166 domain-containing protein n=1 Tax=Curtobacterium TaxID=2034 RepID=UPI00068C01D2|nr:MULTISPECIES: DUF4166 domain-containing protein [Curtobacterium]MBT1606878.1 DUF4166 domain-containing protein [Curtobacterium flaccumfaciens pv. betae]MBT1657950.1 DUF4166 domain-containing protein [Curtobacterium flaccumfaciens pv. betae]MCS0471420.1 DUF4166 domain-containing protein [Curtobacterium flaccumfaciens pv. betae]MCS0475861.1 DUF4166 domain-containing protein [Curtobacterium flaccumfaciens pv. betae]MCS0478136.1 DUF4166 domain-containing protein [Curtobacterium flaccumfaciens p